MGCRAKYTVFPAPFASQLFLLDKRHEEGGFWVGCSNSDMEQILDTKKCTATWEALNKWENLIQKTRKVLGRVW
jgi:hypothetical protein